MISRSQLHDLGNSTLARIAATIKKCRERNFFATLLIVLGVALLIYVGSQYGEMLSAQNKLEATWEAHQQWRGNGATSAAAHSLKDDGMIRLIIPKIELTSFVVEGTNHKSLLLGPGHMTSTAKPGEPGNAVISAHRDTFFRHIHELDKGDVFYIDRGGKRFTYQVTDKKIVEPTDVSVLQPSSDSQITLITCYPTYFIGPAPKRLVVISKLVKQFDTPPTAAKDELRSLTHVEPVSAGATH